VTAATTAITHQRIRAAILDRIKAGEWGLGEQMPGEAQFAEEYGCARTTMNRALRALADEGIVERKRKGGTRVRPLPRHHAQLTIPILREQVEASGQLYGHRIVARHVSRPPPEVAAVLALADGQQAAGIDTLHLADHQPYALEHRWVNLETVPAFAENDFAAISPNEWLVRTVPFSTGKVSLSATSADAEQARLLGVAEGVALFTLRRTTWLAEQTVTTMTLLYPPGHSLDFSL
jgi:GntR family transcriptional regulator, histidine utilization repressor